jgi:hypothetical protein
MSTNVMFLQVVHCEFLALSNLHKMCIYALVVQSCFAAVALLCVSVVRGFKVYVGCLSELRTSVPQQ